MDHAKIVGRLRVLRKHCYGMMARLLHINSSTLSAGGRSRPLILQSSDYASKMRKKLESAFPEAPDVCKGPQFDHTAPQTASQLQDIFDCFEEIAELKDIVLSTLREFCNSRSSSPLQLKVSCQSALHLSYLRHSLNLIYIRAFNAIP